MVNCYVFHLFSTGLGFSQLKSFEHQSCKLGVVSSILTEGISLYISLRRSDTLFRLGLNLVIKHFHFNFQPRNTFNPISTACGNDIMMATRRFASRQSSIASPPLLAMPKSIDYSQLQLRELRKSNVGFMKLAKIEKLKIIQSKV